MNESSDPSASLLFVFVETEREGDALRFGEAAGIVGASNRPSRSVHVESVSVRMGRRGEGTHRRADSK